MARDPVACHAGIASRKQELHEKLRVKGRFELNRVDLCTPHGLFHLRQVQGMTPTELLKLLLHRLHGRQRAVVLLGQSQAAPEGPHGPSKSLFSTVSKGKKREKGRMSRPKERCLQF